MVLFCFNLYTSTAVGPIVDIGVELSFDMNFCMRLALVYSRVPCRVLVQNMHTERNFPSGYLDVKRQGLYRGEGIRSTRSKPTTSR